MITLVRGNALHIPLPDKSVQCVVTSPPYWGLRDYGTARWNGGDPDCDHIVGEIRTGAGMAALGDKYRGGGHKAAEYKPLMAKGECPKCGAIRADGQLGLEKTPEEYVANMVAVFREVWRVMRDDGTLWLNLGDCYVHSEPGGGSVFDNGRTGGRKSYVGDKPRGREKVSTLVRGLKTKNMVGIPWRVAFALQADGWYLRSDIIWHKPNPMPESVRDRPTKAHEYLFLLTKAERYFYDAEAVKEPGSMASLERISQPNFDNQTGGDKDYGNGTNKNRSMRKTLENWKHSTDKQRGRDGDGERKLKKSHPAGDRAGAGNKMGRGAGWRDNPECYSPMRNKRTVWTIATAPYSGAHFATFPPALVEPCILAGSAVGDYVMDPFSGSGTVGQVCLQHGRRYVGVELKMDYIDLARERLYNRQIGFGM